MSPPSIFSQLGARLAQPGQFRGIIANAGWLFMDKLLRMGIGLVIGIWMARYLGVADFGHLNYAIAFASLFSAIATLGLDGIVIRELVRHPDQKHELLGSVFALKLIGGCIAVSLVLGSIFLLRPADTTTHLLVGIIATGMIFQAFDVIDFWFQSEVQSKFTVYARSSAFLLISAVKAALILGGAGLVAFAWASLAEIIVGSAGLVIAYRATGNSLLSMQARFPVATRLLHESWPLMLSGLAILLYMRIDQVMLGEISGEHEVGLYSAALRLSEVWYVIPTVIISSVMPALTRARSSSEQHYYQRLQQLFTFLARTAYVVAIPMTIFSTPLVTLLFGEQFSAAGPVLAVHIWAALFVFLGVAQSPWTINEGLARINLYYTSLGAIINIALNYYLIPVYGALGCAIATTVSYGFSAWLANGLSKRTRRIFRLQSRAVLLGFGS